MPKKQPQERVSFFAKMTEFGQMSLRRTVSVSPAESIRERLALAIGLYKAGNGRVSKEDAAYSTGLLPSDNLTITKDKLDDDFKNL